MHMTVRQLSKNNSPLFLVEVYARSAMYSYMMKRPLILICLAIAVSLSCLSVSSAQTRLPPEWLAILEKICLKFDDSQPDPPVINRMCSLQSLQENMRNPIIYLFPPVIVWSPVEQFKGALPIALKCPKCSLSNDQPLAAVRWQCGAEGERSEPHRIYGCDGVAVLIGRVYKCTQGHEVVGYHPGILAQIPDSLVPFRLWHKTGFTNELINLVCSLITAGMSITNVRILLSKKQVSLYYCRLKHFESLNLSITVERNFPTLDMWKKCFSSFCPSVHTLSGCFLADFWLKEKVYTRCMQSTTIDEVDDPWLSLDHTFASAKNIGCSRTGDNHWITQYEALFCVLNGKGQVVTWRLTPRLTFSEVEFDLIALKNRLDLHGKVLKEFYIDNCCSWRKKLQQIFGKDLVVYLDIFHAVKRFSDKISKRHPLRKECLREWKMVFRDPSDQGKQRHLPTPSPHILEANLDKFLQHWAGSEYDGKKTLSEAALKEIESIRVHVNKGCLSGIKCGRGTNRNENLHKDLNRIMSSSKYGVELAYALLTVVFFNHNERMAAIHDNRNTEYPIEHYCSSQCVYSSPAMDETFGLKFTNKKHSYHTSQLPDNTCCSSSDLMKELALSKCNYTQLYQRILHTQPPHTGHVRQTDEFIDMSSSKCDFEGDDDMDEDDEEDGHQSIPVTVLKNILVQALSWFSTHKSMMELSETARVVLSEFPFMLSTSSDLFTPIMLVPADEDLNAHERHLDEVIASWNMVRQTVLHDGNCLFYSVAHNIKVQVERGNSELEEILMINGIPAYGSIKEIADALRKGVVKEWTGEQSQTYQLFMTKDQLHAQAEEFKKDGVYSLDVGDLAIAALSNLLQTAIVVLTSRPHQPIHIQHPTHSPMKNTHPIYLAYLQYGPGHYDAVVPESLQSTPVIISIPVATKDVTCCSCGRKKTKGDPCSFSLAQYTCRCPCYNSKQPCTQECKCKGCTNTYGIKPPPQSPAPGQKRKRFSHKSQTVPLRGKRTTEFMEAVGEPVKIGGFSAMEYLLVCSIVQHLMEATWDWDNIQNIDANEVGAIYHHIIKLAKLLRIHLALFQRTPNDIQKILTVISSKWEVFRQQNMVVKVFKKC